MDLRATLVLLMAVQCCDMGFGNADADGWCQRVCTGSRPATPPTCPPSPPTCPVPVCPPPVVNLTCPEPRCPPTDCPPCPVSPACAPSPTPLPAGPAAPPTAAPVFPHGYDRYFNVGVYKFYPDAAWLQANATCSADGAHLAVPKTEPEVDVLLYIMERKNTRKAFIGFHDYFCEGNYMTVLGQPMNGFQHSLWGSGEPVRGVQRNSVYLKSNGHIYAYENTGIYPFICELRRNL